MNKILLAFAIVMPLCFVSCEKTIEEGDDFVQGKWRDLEVISNEDLENYNYRDYIEYAPYHHQLNKRKITYYVYDSDSTYETKVGRYTIKGDTLIVVDHMEVTKTYFLQSVKKDTMRYLDAHGKLYTYVRYKGTEYIPPTPSEEEEEGDEEK
ncbi:MAG: hypothetical protein HUK18_03380 [Bacteroidales bacterium]|nr:hypothetical protein [Bacteroidales bacterium]